MRRDPISSRCHVARDPGVARLVRADETNRTQMSEQTPENGECRTEDRSEIQSALFREDFAQGGLSLAFPGFVLTPHRPSIRS